MAANILEEIEDLFDPALRRSTAEALGVEPDAFASAIRPGVAKLTAMYASCGVASEDRAALFETVCEFEGAICINYPLILESGSINEVIELGWRTAEGLFGDAHTDESTVGNLTQITGFHEQRARPFLNLMAALIVDVAGAEKITSSMDQEEVSEYFNEQWMAISKTLSPSTLEAMGLLEKEVEVADDVGLSLFAPGAMADFTPPIRDPEFDMHADEVADNMVADTRFDDAEVLQTEDCESAYFDTGQIESFDAEAERWATQAPLESQNDFGEQQDAFDGLVQMEIDEHHYIVEDQEDLHLVVDDDELAAIEAHIPEAGDFIDRSGVGLSSEQRLEVRFKALLAGVLLSVAWLFAFAKGRDAAEDQTQLVAKTSLTAPAQDTIDIDVDISDVKDEVEKLETELIIGGKPPVLLTAVDHQPILATKGAIAAWTSPALTEASKAREVEVGVSELPVDALPADLIPDASITRLQRQLGVGRQDLPKLSVSSPTEPPSDLSRLKFTTRMVSVQYEDADQQRDPPNVKGFQVIDGGLRIPVFDAPRETGSSYFSN